MLKPCTAEEKKEWLRVFGMDNTMWEKWEPKTYTFFIPGGSTINAIERFWLPVLKLCTPDTYKFAFVFDEKDPKQVKQYEALTRKIFKLPANYPMPLGWCHPSWKFAVCQYHQETVKHEIAHLVGMRHDLDGKEI